MSVLEISRGVRLAVEARLSEAFNAALAEASGEFGVPDELLPPFNFGEASELPANFYRGAWMLPDMLERLEPEWPAMAMWTGEGQDQSTQKPRAFSGAVAVYWRFWLVIPGLRRAGLVDMREAVESALVATLNPEGLRYRGDLSWGQLMEQSILGQDERHFGWLQEITYTAGFEVDT
jgi:hypothetical protein